METENPFRMHLNGRAGCGKTFVINCIRKKYGGAVVLTSTTGTSASNINGDTIHSKLMFPIDDKKMLVSLTDE